MDMVSSAKARVVEKGSRFGNAFLRRLCVYRRLLRRYSSSMTSAVVNTLKLMSHIRGIVDDSKRLMISSMFDRIRLLIR